MVCLKEDKSKLIANQMNIEKMSLSSTTASNTKMFVPTYFTFLEILKTNTMLIL